MVGQNNASWWRKINVLVKIRLILFIFQSFLRFPKEKIHLANRPTTKSVKWPNNIFRITIKPFLSSNPIKICCLTNKRYPIENFNWKLVFFFNLTNYILSEMAQVGQISEKNGASWPYIPLPPPLSMLRGITVYVSLGFVHILRNHFPELADWILRPEVATVGCGRRPQHLWSHRNPYSWSDASTVPCAQKAQDSISHRWLRNMWMFPN